MFKKYKKMLFINLEKYNKKATNPFLKNNSKYNPNKSIYEQTYVWVEKTDTS